MATVLPNPAALRKSGDPLGVFKSSLGQGRIDRGFENLEVVLLHGPAEKDMRVTATLGAAAHAGAFGDVVTFLRDGKIEDLPVDVASIGLQQVMESDTVTFLVYGCTRAFTHEFVRTRKGAWFLQQTLRHTDMGFANQRMPASIAAGSEADQDLWTRSVKQSVSSYQALIAGDVPYEDARTVLPLSTETWIIGGMPMRTWLETFEYRACLMFYPEMRYVFQRMKEVLAESHAWIADQAKITCERKHVCTYRGAEDTEWCPIYPGSREWRSPQYDRAMLDRFAKLKADGS